MAFTATVTSASEVTQDGQQSVVFDITNDAGEFVLTHSLQGDVDQIKDSIVEFLKNYKVKATSNKRVKIGDSWTK
jgi:hypothetical protein